MPTVQQGLTPEQIAAARSWLNANYASAAPEGGFQFNGDFNANAPGLSSFDKADILGANQAMGWNDADLASILGGGITGEQIAGYRSSNPILSGSAVDQASLGFAMDQGWTDSDAYKRAQFGNNDNWLGWSGGAGGGFAEGALRPRSTADNGPAPGTGGGGQGGNPYLQGVFDNISRQYTNTLNEQWLPAIRDNSIAAGGLGGSRAGVAQGLAIGRAGEGLAGALSNAGMGAWENDQNRQLQRYGIDTNASTARYGIDTNAGLTNQGQWMNYDTAQRGLDHQGMGLGMQMMGMGTQMPWYGYGQFNNMLTGASGNNNSTTGNQSSGGGGMGALWGGIGMANLANQYGWWGG